MGVNMGFPSGGQADQGWKLYLTSLIMILSAGLVVVSRIVTRLRANKLKADDYTIIASLAFSIVLSVNIQLAVVHGYGKHKADLSTQDLHTCLKFFWIAQTPYKIVVCLNKTSVVLLYMRIFISRHFQWLCYAALAIIVASGIATVFATLLQCLPLEKSWDKNIDGVCIDSSKFWLANAVLNIMTDVVVLALPIREVFKLQLKLQEKIMLYSVFLLGGFVTITSILRVTAVANSTHNQKDQTYNFITRGIWTLIEANMGIICACLIVLKQLVKRFFLSMFSTSKNGPSDGYQHGYGGSGGAGGSTKRNPSALEHRQNFNLEYTIDEEEGSTDGSARGRGESVGAGGSKSFHLTSLAHRGTSDGRRKSDEKHIMSAGGIEREHSHSSVESVDIVTSWPLEQRSGITKKVDVQVSSHPSLPAR